MHVSCEMINGLTFGVNASHSGVRLQLGTTLGTVVEILVSPHVHDLIDVTDLGSKVSDEIPQDASLYLEPVLFIVAEKLRGRGRVQGVGSFLDEHVRETPLCGGCRSSRVREVTSLYVSRDPRP